MSGHFRQRLRPAATRHPLIQKVATKPIPAPDPAVGQAMLIDQAVERRERSELQMGDGLRGGQPGVGIVLRHLWHWRRRRALLLRLQAVTR